MALNLYDQTPAELAEEFKQTAVAKYLKHLVIPPRPNATSGVSHSLNKPPVASQGTSDSVKNNNTITTSNNNGPIDLGNIDTMSISNSQIELQQRPLGEGSFGVVYSGVWRHTKFHCTPVAVKQLKLQSLPAKLLEDFKHEIKLHSELDSPAIVKFYGITAEQPYYIIMELMTQGSLRDLLDTKKLEQLSWEIRLSIAKNIAQGLSYLHEHKPPIYHGDIKSLNVLLTDGNQAKLGDFGLATVKVETSSRTYSQSSNKPKGSLLWMAPELFKMNAKRGEKTDIYSFAVVLWELASHLFPYSSANGDESLIRSWVMSGERESFDDRTPNTPAEYQTLAEKCWCANPVDRLNSKQALNALDRIKLQGKAPPTPAFFAQPAAAMPPLQKQIPKVTTEAVKNPPKTYLGNIYK